MLGVTLKRLTELWEKNPRITLTELVTMCESDAQNVKRWMKSAGFAKVVDNDKKCRFVRRVDIKRITHTPPEGLTEAQRTQFYIHLGYDSYSICVHQNVLLSTVEERREAFNKSQPEPGCASSGFAKATPDRSLASLDRQLPLNSSQPDKGEEHWEVPVLAKVASSPEERENASHEDGQHKNNFEELGDKRPHHIDDITQELFFPKGIPTCQRCQREVTYTDIIHYNNVHPKFPGSFINVDARPKIVFPVSVAYAYVDQWANYVDFPRTGYKDIDEIRIVEAFVADAIANLIRNRLAWIVKELLSGNKGKRTPYREGQGF